MKKGDTLIEVMLAVGIFSMVAVAVVAVMSNGTAGAQTSLETTLAREEIDAQAEALRFIQSAYISDGMAPDDRYTKLWKTITSNAIDLNHLTGGVTEESILQYSPNTCDELYSTTTRESQKPFIINTRYLGEYSSVAKNAINSSISKVYVNNKLSAAVTYPHLVFGTSSTRNTDEDALAANNTYTNLYKAEGIYIVAVKDSGTTNIVTTSDVQKNRTAFYDFYIRTCWYGIGDRTPSTISTVIRLYDPEAVVTKPTD